MVIKDAKYRDLLLSAQKRRLSLQ